MSLKKGHSHIQAIVYLIVYFQADTLSAREAREQKAKKK